jgi:hypothetical protein
MKKTLTAIALVAGLTAALGGCTIADTSDQAQCLYHRYGLLAGAHSYEACDGVQEAAEEALRPAPQPLFVPRPRPTTCSGMSLGDGMFSATCQ